MKKTSPYYLIWGKSGREVQEGGDMHVFTTDSCCCMAEHNTVRHYPPIKLNLKIKKLYISVQFSRSVVSDSL